MDENVKEITDEKITEKQMLSVLDYLYARQIKYYLKAAQMI